MIVRIKIKPCEPQIVPLTILVTLYEFPDTPKKIEQLFTVSTTP